MTTIEKTEERLLRRSRVLDAAATLAAISSMATLVWLSALLFALGVSAVFSILVMPTLAAAGFITWRKDESHTAGRWLGMAVIGAATTFVFAWLDCGTGAVPWPIDSCLSRSPGFSLILTIGAWAYTVVCVGGSIRSLFRG